MGQYQQWLLYQETDRSLQAQLEDLEAQLARLQEHAYLLEQSVPAADNQLLRILSEAFSSASQTNYDAGFAVDLWTTPAPATAANGSFAHSETAETYHVLDEPGTTISPALFARGQLPNFDSQDIPQPLEHEGKALPPIPHPEMDLLPEDMATFFEEHSSTDPQLQIPRWLHNLTVSAGNSRRVGPIDQESIRTNRLVQRWFERWGRLPPNASTPPEDASHE